MDKKKLAPPPHHKEKVIEERELKTQVEEQRTAARQKAETRRSRRLSEKKRDFLDTVGQAMSEMVSMNEELSASLNELESIMNEISASAMQSSSATEQNNAAIAQSDNAVNLIADRNMVILEKVGFLQNLLKNTTIGLSGLISGVNLSADNIQKTVGQIDTLNRQAAAIEQAIAGIVAVTKKVNLHALNAGIEASKADEFGAGFSVVAEEIRRLAEESNRFSAEIDPALQMVRKDVINIGQDLNAMIKQARADNSKANEITANIDSAVEDIVTLQQRGDRINSLSQSHQVLFSKILDNSRLIAVGASQASTSSHTALSAIQQQVKAIDSVAKNAEDIENQIEVLKDQGFSEAAAEEVATSAEELSAIVEESSAAIAQIVSAIAEIAQSAEQQSRAAGDNSGVIEEIEKQANEIAAIGENNQQQTLKQQQLMQTIDREARAMFSSMTETAETFLVSAEKINALQESMENLEIISQQMANLNIVGMLLAINGRIESARAGEQGSGFAAVSDEIRALVIQADDENRQISRGLRNIQKTITSISAGIEYAGNQIKQEVDKTKESTTSLVQVEQDMVEIAGQTAEIMTATSQSFAAIESIKMGIETIASAAAQASAACQQASAAAEEQGKGIRQLASSAEEIANQADTI